MPPIIKILAVLFVVLVIVVMVTEKKPTTITPEQAAGFRKWMNILIPLLMLVMAVGYFIRL